MANQEHLDILNQGVETWNQWRIQYPDTQPDLSMIRCKKANLKGINLSNTILTESNFHLTDFSGANLHHADLSNADLHQANLSNANLSNANLREADLRGANLDDTDFSYADLSYALLPGASLSLINLFGACLSGANLSEANLVIHGGFLRGSLEDILHGNLHKGDLRGADLSHANVGHADLSDYDLSRANLSEADLREVNLSKTDLSGANLSGANLSGANLSGANLSGANLSGANLQYAVLVRTNLTLANLINCHIYGISAWDVQLQDTTQSDLIITDENQPTITVDNLEVAQFIHLLLNNVRIRHVIDTITSKVVLILGRFTPERKAILDAIRDELRKRNYLPVLFDFEKPANRDITETVSTLAHMARFVIADITEPKSIPQELSHIIPFLPSVPIVPLLQVSEREYGMYEHFVNYPWVQPIYHYHDLEELLQTIQEHVIELAEGKVRELTIEKAKRLERP